MLSKMLFDSETLHDLLEDQRLWTLTYQRLCAACDKQKAAEAEVKSITAELNRISRVMHSAKLVAIRNAEGSA